MAGAPGLRVNVCGLRGGRPAPVPIVIGFSDGQNVEVRSGNLHQGDRAIIAQVRVKAEAIKATPVDSARVVG